MWGREVNGVTLTFHLAGINNQNFLMRDEETGTYWQQISGRAISGPLAGSALRRIPSDELTLKLWKAEQPRGTMLKDRREFVAQYAPRDWDAKMRLAPTVLSDALALRAGHEDRARAQPGIAPHDLMLGIQAAGAARAFPYDTVKNAKLVEDRVGSEPVLLVVGQDGESVRAFSRKLPDGRGAADFYRTADGDALMMDSITGSRWDFQGCAIEDATKGVCLARLQVTKDYWFDWRNYNPETTVFGRK